MSGEQFCPFLWRRDGGSHGTSYSTARDAFTQIVNVMLDVGGTTAPFTLEDISRTVETRLAAADINRDICAQVESHGLSGVQYRYYDRYSYLDEKRAALETLRKLL